LANTEITEKTYAIATFYRAGVLGVKQLINIGVPPKNIRIVTYERPRNESALEFYEKKGVEYTTAPIDDDSTVDMLTSFNPDLLFSLYYQDKIPDEVLELPDYKGVNLHPSLLPRHAGSLSVPWAMFEHDDQTGYTYHYMTNEIDGGPILLQNKIAIEPEDTAYSLNHRVLHAGIAEFRPIVEMVLSGSDGKPQSGDGSFHYSEELPNDGIINHNWSRKKIDRFIRAMYYPPFQPAIAEFDGREFEVTSIKEYEKLREKFE
jgi:methionyl-tRNA formyltransferase